MPAYSLKTILSTISNPNGNKRTIFNSGPVGGVNSTFVLLFFISLPFIEYAVLFNPYVFKILGIATSIVVFIVSLSFVMIIIFVMTLKIKKRVVEKIAPSWNKYFDGIPLDMVVASGITPYSRFFEFYSKVAAKDLSEDRLYEYLIDSFKTMEEENKDLLEALRRDKKIC